jgi:hypothetical protein
MGKTILSEPHKDELERDAALLEFEHGLPREQAEKQAYDSYSKKHHQAGAAHHLMGLRAAQANNDLEEAKKHGIAYGFHLNALGLDPLDQVPDEINELINEDGRKSHYKFKAHPSDKFFLAEHKTEPKEEK